MPRIPLFSFGHEEHEATPPRLNGFTPSLMLEGLQLGVDNLRHDREPPITIDDAMETLRIALAATRAQATGKSVSLQDASL